MPIIAHTLFGTFAMGKESGRLLRRAIRLKEPFVHQGTYKYQYDPADPDYLLINGERCRIYDNNPGGSEDPNKEAV